jgi:hypothetical protein
MLTTATSPTDDVARSLTILRLSGDERNLKVAAAQAELDGSAVAATGVAHDIDLLLYTRTMEDPAAYVARLRPSFREYSVLRAVRSLMPAADDAMRRAVIGHDLALGGQQDQLTAKGWAGVVSAEPSCWIVEDAHEAAIRASDLH